jgi:hypothetical protein
MVLRLRIQLLMTAKGSCELQYRAMSVREMKSDPPWEATVMAEPWTSMMVRLALLMGSENVFLGLGHRNPTFRGRHGCSWL